MPRARSPKTKKKQQEPAGSLMVRMDNQSKSFISKAAQLRQVSISDYVRTVTVAQARREVESSRDRTIALTSQEQLDFWKALNERPKLTAAQKKLGKIMRGES